MTSSPAGPRCPRCRRPLAAWRLEHCVYCGEAFPSDLKQGFEEPEALKWIERPALPLDASRKLEMMKVVPIGTRKRSRSLVVAAGILSVPLFAAIFYLLYTMVRQLLPTTSILVLIGGAGFVGYLVWIFARAARK